MSLKYMGVPDRCPHGVYKDVQCDKCEIVRLRNELRTANRDYAIEHEHARIQRELAEEAQADAVNWKLAVEDVAKSMLAANDELRKTIRYMRGTLELLGVTCAKCGAAETCEFAWDAYNTDGDCLGEK